MLLSCFPNVISFYYVKNFILKKYYFKVLWNPFDDIVPRAPTKPVAPSTVDSDNKDTKKKAVK